MEKVSTRENIQVVEVFSDRGTRTVTQEEFEGPLGTETLHSKFIVSVKLNAENGTVTFPSEEASILQGLPELFMCCPDHVRIDAVGVGLPIHTQEIFMVSSG